MVVCFPAGGGTDIAARLVNIQLGEALGKPVIIENRGGAGGNIAIQAVKRLPADGYTLLVCSSAYVVNPSLYANAAYDPIKDFVPLMVLGASPNVFVVPEKSEIKSMKEFIEKAKANPDKFNWTSPGAGTTPQLAGELIKLRTGIKMQHIPFPGAGPATNAVLAGTVDLYTANIGSVQGLIDGGKVRPIAVTSKTRWAPLPNVPTLEEIGIKDAESDTFQGIYVLAGTPQPVIDRLAKELSAILAPARHEGEVRQDRAAGGGGRPGGVHEARRARGADVQGGHRQGGLEDSNEPNRSPESASSNWRTSSPARCAARCWPTWAPTWSRSSRRAAT